MHVLLQVLSAYKGRFLDLLQPDGKNLPSSQQKEAKQSRNLSVSFFGLLNFFFAINQVYLRH